MLASTPPPPCVFSACGTANVYTEQQTGFNALRYAGFIIRYLAYYKVSPGIAPSYLSASMEHTSDDERTAEESSREEDGSCVHTRFTNKRSPISSVCSYDILSLVLSTASLGSGSPRTENGKRRLWQPARFRFLLLKSDKAAGHVGDVFAWTRFFCQADVPFDGMPRAFIMFSYTAIFARVYNVFAAATLVL